VTPRPPDYANLFGPDWTGYWVRQELAAADLDIRTVFKVSDFEDIRVVSALVSALRLYFEWVLVEQVDTRYVTELTRQGIRIAGSAWIQLVAAFIDENGPDEAIELDTGFNASPLTQEVIDLIEGL